MKRRWMINIVVAVCLSFPIGAPAADFSNIVAFGDSLSDNGNIFAISPESCPEETYYQGHFSNGIVWVDYLAQSDYLDATLLNNAYGGAETTGVTPLGLIEQVAAYTAAASLPENALFTIWIGGNDFLGGSAEYEQSADNVTTALNALADFGAEHILVLNLPDLGATPRKNGNDQASLLATTITQSYNSALQENVEAFDGENPDITVYFMDIFELFKEISEAPDEYGFSNVDAICPSFLVADDFDNDDGYLFWDDIHPTTEAHEKIAEEVKTLVAPNPSSNDDDDGDSGCFINSLALAW